MVNAVLHLNSRLRFFDLRPLVRDTCRRYISRRSGIARGIQAARRSEDSPSKRERFSKEDVSKHSEPYARCIESQRGRNSFTSKETSFRLSGFRSKSTREDRSPQTNIVERKSSSPSKASSAYTDGHASIQNRKFQSSRPRLPPNRETEPLRSDDGSNNPKAKSESQHQSARPNRKRPRRGPNTGRGQSKAQKPVFARENAYSPNERLFNLKKDAKLENSGRENHKEIDIFSIPRSQAASTFAWGARAAMAILRAQRRKVYKLYVSSSIDDAASKHDSSASREVMEKAQELRIPVSQAEPRFIKRVVDSIEKHEGQPSITDGILLETSKLPNLPVRAFGPFIQPSKTFAVELSAQSSEDAQVNGTETGIPFSDRGWRAPFVLWLHGIVDQRNAGALIRSAFYFGADGVLFSSVGTAGLGQGLLRTAAGAAEHIRLFNTEDPTGFIRQSQVNGWRFIAAAPPNNEDIWGSLSEVNNLDRAKLATHPTVLVLGNESEGLENWLLKSCDEKVSIRAPASQAAEAELDSLNVSVAGGILLERLLVSPLETLGQDRRVLRDTASKVTNRQQGPNFGARRPRRS